MPWQKSFGLQKNQQATVTSYPGNRGEEISKLQTFWKTAQCSQDYNP